MFSEATHHSFDFTLLHAVLLLVKIANQSKLMLKIASKHVLTSDGWGVFLNTLMNSLIEMDVFYHIRLYIVSPGINFINEVRFLQHMKGLRYWKVDLQTLKFTNTMYSWWSVEFKITSVKDFAF